MYCLNALARPYLIYRGVIVMSAIGTKRTSQVAPHMSAFGGKADVKRQFATDSTLGKSGQRGARGHPTAAVFVRYSKPELIMKFGV